MFCILYYYCCYLMPAEAKGSSACLFCKEMTTWGQMTLGWGRAKPNLIAWGPHSCAAPEMRGCPLMCPHSLCSSLGHLIHRDTGQASVSQGSSGPWGWSKVHLQQSCCWVGQGLCPCPVASCNGEPTTQRKSPTPTTD